MARLDFSADQYIFDNLEEVTFTSVRTAGNVSVVVADAGVYEDGLSEAQPSHGVYTRERYRFTVRGDELLSVGGAKPRDTVTFDSNTYTVLEAALGEITNFWQLRCVRLILAADLDQSGVLTRPSNAQDTTGRASLATYSTVGTVNCRVQPISGVNTDVFGRVTQPKRFNAFLESSLGAKAKDVFTVSGTAYSVIEEQNVERLDELPMLVLELIE